MFDNILGHEKEKKLLEQDIKDRSVSHAYLFLGPGGIGKKKLALEFAKTLLCTENLESCADYRYIEKLSDKKDIVIEQIREKIVNDIYIVPATGEYKVYIIDDAQLMNSASQNALLKTLEEPPSYIVIILITDNENILLKTVISRLKKVAFYGLPDEIIQHIVNIKNGKELSIEQLSYIEGSAKLALEISQVDGENKYLKIEKLYGDIKKRDKLGVMRSVENVDFKDKETFNYLEHLFIQDQEYDKVSDVEKIKNRIEQNANEDIVKQAFCIKLLRKG